MQICERLHHEGQDLSMSCQPLDRYFELAGVAPKFDTEISAELRRGYVGTWEIRDDRLYLIGLEGTLLDGTKANLATVFPDYPEGVFAHWYSVRLRMLRGRLVEPVYMGDQCKYEPDLLIDVRKGMLVKAGGAQ